MKSISFKAQVCVFPMVAPWLYVDVPFDLVPKVPRRGWGSIPIMATVGKTTWRTSIFPMKKDHYFIPLKKQIRVKEDIRQGDFVTVSYHLATTTEL